IGDPDKDGLSNEQEETAGTDPQSPDTDNDGLDDGSEVAYGLNPLVAYPNPAIIEAHLDTLKRGQGEILANPPIIWPENGMIHLQLQLMMGEDLLDMTPLGEPVDFTAPAPVQGPLFYQINVE
ncbi:MAG: hypothetical protein AB3N33_11535, partial [Puniceicoccaceae bacterium]